MSRTIAACLLALTLAGVPLATFAQEDAPAETSSATPSNTNTLTKAELRELERARRQAEIERQEAQQRERGAELASREADLAAQRARHTLSHLREILSTIDEDDPRPMEEVTKLRREAEALREEKTRPEKRLELLRRRGEEPDREQVELTERLENLTENLELHRLQIARWTARSTLGLEGGRIDKLVTDLPVNPRPSVRLLAEKRHNLESERNRLTELEAAAAEMKRTRDGIAPAVQLLENKTTQLADTIRLLEEKHSLTRDRAVRDQIDIEKSRVEPFADRLEILRNQVLAIDEALAEGERLAALYRAEIAVLREDYDLLWQRYWRSVLVPLGLIIGLSIVYLFISRLILPRVYKRDRLFIARRMGLYLCILIILGVILSFFFDDLRPFATTLGIAGAAVVIALQDLCSSFAGWFVIVASRKIHVGDRIEVDGHIGDVLDVQLLRTTVLELRGWLGVDEPTGRVIVIPNSFIFKDKFFNFNHVHPYIWNKIDVTITLETPFREAEALLMRILQEETKEDFAAARQGAGRMERAYGVPDSEYVPKLHSTIVDSGISYHLLFVSHFREVDQVRTRINGRILAEFAKDPRMQLAYPTQRQING